MLRATENSGITEALPSRKDAILAHEYSTNTPFHAVGSLGSKGGNRLEM
jgi:hypothetical protein